MIEFIIGSLAVIGIMILVVCAIAALYWFFDSGAAEAFFCIGLFLLIVGYGVYEFYQAAMWLGDKIIAWGAF